MDFIKYCENVLEPNLEMVCDMYHDGIIDKVVARLIGEAMCNVETCLLDNEMQEIHSNILSETLERFYNGLQI